MARAFRYQASIFTVIVSYVVIPCIGVPWDIIGRKTYFTKTNYSIRFLKNELPKYNFQFTVKYIKRVKNVHCVYSHV